jgi:hypothetical protein
MRIGVMLLAAAAALAGCNQGGGNTTGSQSANDSANSAAAAPKHPTYCFFKDSDTKSWSAGRGAGANVTVKGKAHLDDTRYMAGLGQPEISGSTAKLWLTMDPNGGPYAAPGNWWDVTAAIAGSSGVDAVTIMCGTKTVAQLKVAGGR